MEYTPIKVLQECAAQLSYPLFIIFRISLEEGRVPTDRKSAVVTPIHKKGNLTVPGNYRLTSLRSILCKVLESLLRDQMLVHTEKYELATHHQHGFTARRSCLPICWKPWKLGQKPTMQVMTSTNIPGLPESMLDSVLHKRLLKKLHA